MRRELGRVLMGLTVLAGGRFLIMLWASLAFGDATAGPAPHPAEPTVRAVRVIPVVTPGQLPAPDTVADPAAGRDDAPHEAR